MPELPEVETVRSTLEPILINESILDVEIIYEKIIKHDINQFKDKIRNQTIHQVNRIGKYLILILDFDALIIHLRMEGKFFIKHEEPVLAHEHIIFKLSNHKELRYHDVRKFGTMHLIPLNLYVSSYPLNQLGPEPFYMSFEQLKQSMLKKNTEIKGVLLDQTIMSGLGNIYVDETLFLSHIHPERKASSLSDIEIQAILDNAKKVLKKAIELGGTTIRSYTSSLGIHGRFQNELCVHMKKDEPCIICQTPIKKIKVKGRGTYVCEQCQH